MKCWTCKKELKYNAGVTFFFLEANEMMWGEHSVFPGLLGKYMFCSLDCIKDWITELGDVFEKEPK